MKNSPKINWTPEIAERAGNNSPFVRGIMFFLEVETLSLYLSTSAITGLTQRACNQLGCKAVSIKRVLADFAEEFSLTVSPLLRPSHAVNLHNLATNWNLIQLSKTVRARAVHL